jgi:hypothetical protein
MFTLWIAWEIGITAAVVEGEPESEEKAGVVGVPAAGEEADPRRGEEADDMESVVELLVLGAVVAMEDRDLDCWYHVRA